MTRNGFLAIPLILLLAVFAGAAVSAKEARRMIQPISLPGQTQHSVRGVSGGMSIGPLTKAGCQTITQWQGNAAYAYTPWISGGASFRFFGGAIDERYSLVYTRYFMDTRFHYRTGDFDLFLGPQVGIDNSDLFNRRDNRAGQTQDSIVSTTGDSYCNDRFEVAGAGAGWNAGMGFRISRLVGLALGNSFEYSVQGKSALGFTGGMNFDLWQIWDKVQSSTDAAFLTADGVWMVDATRLSADFSLLLGFSLGF